MGSKLLMIATYGSPAFALLAPFFAQRFLRIAKDSPLIGEIYTCIKALDRHRATPNSTDDIANVDSPVKEGVKFEIYSHYLGLTAQMIAGLVIAFIAVFLLNNDHAVASYCARAVLLLLVVIVFIVVFMDAHRFAPANHYLAAPPGLFVPPSWKAPITWVRLIIFLMVIGLGIVLSWPETRTSNETPNSQHTAVTAPQSAAITTPHNIATTTP